MILSAICAALCRAQRNPGSFRVVAIAGFAVLLSALGGCGGGSGNGVTDVTPPAFAGVKNSSSLSTSITVSWSPASDNVTASWDIVYQVYRSQTSGFTPSPANLIATTARGALSYDDTGLVGGSTYSYVVRAMDGAGNTDTNTVEITASAVSDTTPPAFGGATGVSAIGTNSMTVNWTAGTDNITPQSGIVYLIYRSTTTTMNYTTPTATTVPGVLSYIDTGLTQGTTYYYVVRAKDQAGNIETNTLQTSATTVADTTAPTFAGATTTGSVTQSSITVGWTAATDNVSLSSNIVYLVYRATTSGGQVYTTPLATTAAGATSYTDSGLTASTPYYYVVRAKDEAGNIGTNTAQVSATTLAVSTDTTPPTFAGASSLTVQALPSMTISWVAATDNVTPTGSIVYLVYRSTTSTMNYTTPLVTTAAGATSYVDSTVTAGTKYYYVVRAKDAAGNIDTNTAQVFGPVSFTTDIYNPLMALGTATTCASSGCHNAATTANGGLDLSSAAIAKTSLISKTASECTSQNFVAPGSSSTSYLVSKLTGVWACGSGSQMPKGGPFFTATQINTVKAWIDQGAPNN